MAGRRAFHPQWSAKGGDPVKGAGHHVRGSAIGQCQHVFIIGQVCLEFSLNLNVRVFLVPDRLHLGPYGFLPVSVPELDGGLLPRSSCLLPGISRLSLGPGSLPGRFLPFLPRRASGQLRSVFSSLPFSCFFLLNFVSVLLFLKMLTLPFISCLYTSKLLCILQVFFNKK